MLTRPCVLGGVAVRRVVATTRRAAFLTRSQVNPAGANFNALFTLPAFRPFDRRNSLDMSAGCLSHPCLLLLLQRPVHEGNRDGPLAHCGRHALDIPSADVTHREHSGQTRFEKMGRPGGGPMRGPQVLLRQMGSLLDESFCIECDAPLEPLRTRNCPCHEENMPYVVGVGVAGLIVAPAHPFEMITPFEGHDFGVGSEDDGWILLDTTNQIARHAL